jgi:hypothetical protein
MTDRKQARHPTSVQDSLDPDRPLFSDLPHSRSARYNASLETIFTKILPNWTPNSHEIDILPIAKIPHSKMYPWTKQWMINRKWQPWNTSVHGLHHRQFTKEQEFASAATILDECIAVGSLFSSATFHAVATKAWEELGRDSVTFK